MGSYKYRHWNGKAYQHSDTATSREDAEKLLKKYRKEYKLVKATGRDKVRGKYSLWFIWIHIPSAY